MKIYPSVVENIARNAADHPDKLALADEKMSYTYGQLWKAILSLSAKLKEYGVNKESCAVVECTQNASYMICEFAIQLIGGIFVPLEKNAAPERIKEISDDTNAVIHIGKSPIEKSTSSAAFINISDIADMCSISSDSCDLDDISFLPVTTQLKYFFQQVRQGNQKVSC